MLLNEFISVPSFQSTLFIYKSIGSKLTGSRLEQTTAESRSGFAVNR
jgi:hypothetical protein